MGHLSMLVMMNFMVAPESQLAIIMDMEKFMLSIGYLSIIRFKIHN